MLGLQNISNPLAFSIQLYKIRGIGYLYHGDDLIIPFTYVFCGVSITVGGVSPSACSTVLLMYLSSYGYSILRPWL